MGHSTGSSEETRNQISHLPIRTGVAPTGGNPFYTDALTILDADMPQYIHDNTDDEFSHADFIRAYLASKGASTSELVHLLKALSFVRLPGSTGPGSTKKGPAHKPHAAHRGHQFLG